MVMTGSEAITELSKEEIVEISERLLAQREMPITEREDIVRINVLGLDWYIGSYVVEPRDPARRLPKSLGHLGSSSFPERHLTSTPTFNAGSWSR